MPDDFRCFDAVLLKKVAQIYLEADVVFVVDPVGEEHPQVMALMNEYDRDTVLAALHDVHQLWRDVFEKGRRRRALDSALEAERDPDLRLN
jgi:hypothetical protein